MAYKRVFVRKTYSFDIEVIREAEERKALTGIPISRQLENSWKMARDKLKITV